MVCAGLVAASIPVALQTIVAPTPPGPRNQYINFNVHDTDAEVYFTLHIPLKKEIKLILNIIQKLFYTRFYLLFIFIYIMEFSIFSSIVQGLKFWVISILFPGGLMYF